MFLPGIIADDDGNKLSDWALQPELMSGRRSGDGWFFNCPGE
jgi:hypothetical protein